jgi:hypothetical protein
MLVDLTLNAWKAMVENLNVYVYLDSNPVSFLVKVARLTAFNFACPDLVA